ncbi:sugar phosphate isomerase/epimerase [Microbacterium schleiferi]|uniref:Sugar phosphate isomerase/epimerase n=1 Tax=Microbacterium schleiferi TaxID=69362 RepID=A0A7S8MUL6_9MICO|nr:sugar phosphate isomerase/epimerase [Microbacterium schleiferi]QPE03455.1 sugar phosphate isomerase/epimerase [Microbacterium schleiferi]
MKTALFTKLFADRSSEVVADTAAELGFDGIDLLIREGFPATPADAASIESSLRRFAQSPTPVLTATTDMTDVDRYPVDRVLGACAEAGIPTVRVGYWYYDATERYAAVLERARRELAALAEVASRRGITLLVQLHGGTIHSSGALAAALTADTDPGVVGTYIDPGNQSVQDGREDWRLTFDLLGERLRCVGVKNGGWSAGGLRESGQRVWGSDWLGVADGAVAWDDILRHLRERGYGGVLSFHGHYDLPFGQVVDQTRTDLGFVRRIIEEGR